MPEISNPIPTGVNERAVMVARRNTLMSELLRIAPSLNPPEPAKEYVSTGTPRTVQKREPIKTEKPKEQKSISKKGPDATPSRGDKPDAFADNPNLRTIDGVHIDIYDYFAINPERMTNEQRDRLFYIHMWVLKQGKSFREGLRKLNRLDMKLGCADAGEAKVIKLYNYLRIRYGNAKA